jgi:hypothetical protein
VRNLRIWCVRSETRHHADLQCRLPPLPLCALLVALSCGVEAGVGYCLTRMTCPDGCRYVGGETRLVGLRRTNSYSAFLQQLSKATSAVWDEVSMTPSPCHVCLFAAAFATHSAALIP